MGGLGVGVLADVGQGLLHDPVRGQVDAGRQRLRLALRGDGDREARRPARRHQLGQPGQAGGRLQRRRARGVVVLAQQAQRGLQLPQRGGRGPGQVGEDLLGLLGVGEGQVGGRAGLGVGQGHVVGHHVVELSGDAHPLLGDAQPGLLLAGPLGVLGPGLHGLEVGAPQPGHVAGGEGQHQPEERADRPQQQREVVHGVGDHGRADHAHQGGDAVDAGGLPLGEGGEPVQRRHDRCQQQRCEQVAHGDRRDGAGPGDGDGDARVGAVLEQDEAGHAHEGDGGLVLVGRVGVGQGERGTEGRAGQQRQDRRQIDEEGVPDGELLQAVRVAPLLTAGDHGALRWVGCDHRGRLRVRTPGGRPCPSPRAALGVGFLRCGPARVRPRRPAPAPARG